MVYEYLTTLFVGPNGIKLSGVQNAINTLDTDLQNQIDIINNTTIPTLNAADKTLQANINTEKTRAEEQEAVIRTEFANADAALKNNLLGDAAESYNTLGKLEDAIQAVDAKVIALDVIDSEVIGSYVTSVSQEDGKISSEKKTLVSSTNDNVITFDNVNNGIYLSNVWNCGTFEND